jgi:hypothetical protein
MPNSMPNARRCQKSQQNLVASSVIPAYSETETLLQELFRAIQLTLEAACEGGLRG